MAKSLQQIEDYYLTQGLSGEALRKALEMIVNTNKFGRKEKSK